MVNVGSGVGLGLAVRRYAGSLFRVKSVLLLNSRIILLCGWYVVPEWMDWLRRIVCVSEAANHRAGASSIGTMNKMFCRTMADDWGFNKCTRSVELSGLSLKLDAANPLLCQRDCQLKRELDETFGVECSS